MTESYESGFDPLSTVSEEVDLTPVNGDTAPVHVAPAAANLGDFTQFALDKRILNTLEAGSYTSPTPIQLQAIPPALQGRDIVGIAQTGTGKTAAFSLPSLHNLSQNKEGPKQWQCHMLVLAPTRELAQQIAVSMIGYGRGLGLHVATAFGGVPIGRQRRELSRGTDILVATPGRLLDLVDQRALDLSAVKILVLDEADQMLDLGFIHALKRVAMLVPKQRQSLFFSATMPSSISELAGRFLTNPVKVSVAPTATTAERIEQIAYFPQSADKARLLAYLIRKDEVDRALVFTRTKHGADRLVKSLEFSGIDAVAIHGNKSQPQREKALNAFRKGQVGILVATDIAARGIDITGVSHVFNYELPNVAEQYVHRIGRTGRADASGVAVSLVGPEERLWLRDIEKLTRVDLNVLQLPKGFDRPEVAVLPPPVQGGQRQPRAQARPTGAPRAKMGAKPQGRPAQGGRPARDGQPRDAQPRGEREGGRNDAPRQDGRRDGQPRREGQPRRDGPQDGARRHDAPRGGQREEGRRPDGPRTDRPASERGSADARTYHQRGPARQSEGARPHGNGGPGARTGANNGGRPQGGNRPQGGDRSGGNGNGPRRDNRPR